MNEKPDYRLVGWVSILYIFIFLLIGNLATLFHVYILYEFKKVLNRNFNSYKIDKLITFSILEILLAITISFFGLFSLTTPLIIIKGLLFLFIGLTIFKVNNLPRYLSCTFSINGINLLLIGILYLIFYSTHYASLLEVIKYDSYFQTAILIINNIALGVFFLKQNASNNSDPSLNEPI